MGKEIQKKQFNSSRFLEVILNNKIIFLLVLVLIVLLVYFLIKTNSMQSKFDNTVESIRTEYTNQIDSLKTTSSIQTVKVFSWAVRSEMNRNNLEEVNNLFLAFVRENRVQMINLINPENATIILSTDKKNEGQQVKNEDLLNITEQKIIVDEGRKLLVSPIMGINRMMGILVVEVEN